MARKSRQKLNKKMVLNQKKSSAHVNHLQKKPISSLRGLIKKIKIKGDINDPVLPSLDKY